MIFELGLFLGGLIDSFIDDLIRIGRTSLFPMAMYQIVGIGNE